MTSAHVKRIALAELLEKAAHADKLETVLRTIPDCNVSAAKSAAYYRLRKQAAMIAEITKNMKEDAATFVDDLVNDSDGWDIETVTDAATKALKQ